MSDLNRRIAKLSPEKRALLERRLLKREGTLVSERAIPRRGASDTCFLSFAQERLWFLHQLEPNTPLYNTLKAIRLSGMLDVRALQEALDALVARHESLRTTFVSVDGKPVQVVARQRSLELAVIDLSERPGADREAEVQRLLKKEARRPFNLCQNLMLRPTLLRLGEGEYVLLLALHHIASDGWSVGVLYRELASFYEAFSLGKRPLLPELPIQYADFALWQRRRLTGKVLADQFAYWKKQLEGASAVLELPSDRPRPPVQTFQGARAFFALPRVLAEALRELSRREKVTLFMTLLAAFQTLLYRYTGEDDLVVGSPIAGRTHVETEGLIGLFINTLALRTDLTGNPPFRELLSRVREVALEAYAHQDLPFEKLVEALKPERDLRHTPLFQVMFVLQSASRLELPGLRASFVTVDSRTAKFDVTLSMVEEKGGLRGWLEYNTDLFDATTIKRMLGHFQTLLEGVVADPEQRIGELALLTDAERHQLLVEWNDTKSDYPQDRCVHQLFEAQVERTPEAIAVVFEGQQLTYRELNQQANQLARHLRVLGVGPETLVGICVERSLEMVVGLLGILKAGGAYLPLDPSYPQERLAFMLLDTQAPVLLTQQRLLGCLPKHKARVVCLDEDWRVIAQESDTNPLHCSTAGNLAYVMYTSGSTGSPKGVSVVHQGVVRLVKGINYASLGPEEVFLQFAPLAFDASTFEIWGCLLNGARLVVCPARTLSLEELSQTLQRDQVTVLWLTASLFHLIVDERLEALSHVRQLFAGGDVLSVPHVQKVLQGLKACRVINGYGPTEGTTFSCCYPMTSRSQVRISVPIGRPITNTQVYVLDPHLNPVPIGVPGELYLGGAGLARGYLNRPELTAQKFIPNPFSDEPTSRLYRTGDLARYLPDGNIQFLGRIDHQVKIRGFRVELGEIEAVLGRHPDVRETVVLAREDAPGGKRLVAYIVPAQAPAPTVSELRRFLKQKLPGYMVPSAFVMLEKLPLTPNGKVDRQALPVPDQGRSELEEAYLPPRDLLERQLTSVWEDVLGVQPISVKDDFFELGGHSLLAVRLFARIEQVLDKRIPLALLFQAPTVEQLANILWQEDRPQRWSSLVPIQTEGSKRPFFCLPAAGNTVVGLVELSQQLGPDQPFYGLQSQGLQGEQVPLARVEEMAAHYIEEICTVQPDGPYLLGGICFGGVVAFEMAQQLRAQGQQVALLALFDTAAPTENIRRYSPEWVRYHVHPKQLVRSLAWRWRALRNKEEMMKKVGWIFWRISRLFDPTRYKNQYIADVNRRARRNYLFQVYPGRATLFLSEGRAYRDDQQTKWLELVRGGMDIHVIPKTEHGDILCKPYVQVLAEKLKICLKTAQENRSSPLRRDEQPDEDNSYL